MLTSLLFIVLLRFLAGIMVWIMIVLVILVVGYGKVLTYGRGGGGGDLGRAVFILGFKTRNKSSSSSTAIMLPNVSQSHTAYLLFTSYFSLVSFYWLLVLKTTICITFLRLFKKRGSRLPPLIFLILFCQHAEVLSFYSITPSFFLLFCALHCGLGLIWVSILSAR